MHPLLIRHRDDLLALARKRGIDRMRVFGSMARGDATESSDVDLLVSLPAKGIGLALGGLVADIQDLLGRRVDLVTEGGLHPLIRQRIVDSAVEL
ncbi:MAG: nucleotidyltransferase family protein [Burkholderiales bacterium]